LPVAKGVSLGADRRRKMVPKHPSSLRRPAAEVKKCAIKG
jgi:hypothetical protein